MPENWWKFGIMFWALLAAVSTTTVYNFTVEDIDGKQVSLKEIYDGKVLLIVNVATRGDLVETNFFELQALYQRYEADGLKVAAFPSNQFNTQRNETDIEIKAEILAKFNVTFDLFHVVDVSGPHAIPLYGYLTRAQGHGRPIGSDFEKFLVNRKGSPIRRSVPEVDPIFLDKYILRELRNDTSAGEWILD